MEWRARLKGGVRGLGEHFRFAGGWETNRRDVCVASPKTRKSDTGEFSDPQAIDVNSLLSEFRPTLITNQELNQGVLVGTIRTWTYANTEHRVILSVA